MCSYIKFILTVDKFLYSVKHAR